MSHFMQNPHGIFRVVIPHRMCGIGNAIFAMITKRLQKTVGKAAAQDAVLVSRRITHGVAIARIFKELGLD